MVHQRVVAQLRGVLLFRPYLQQRLLLLPIRRQVLHLCLPQGCYCHLQQGQLYLGFLSLNGSILDRPFDHRW